MHNVPPGQPGKRVDQPAALALAIENNLQAQIWVISSSTVVRQRLSDLLSADGHAVSTFANLSGLKEVPRPDAPLCIVQDYDDGMLPGAELSQILSAAGVPPAWLLLLGANAPVALAVCAMRVGAFDVLARDIADATLLSSVTEAVAHQRRKRQSYIPVAIVARYYASLTPRERQVLALVCEGKRNREMADILQLSEISIKMHRSNVMRKMHVRTLADLVRSADLLR